MTLRLFSPWSPSVMRSLPWAARTAGAADAAGHNPLDPDDAAFYRDGEFLVDDGNGNLMRGGTNHAGAREVDMATQAFQIFGERGRTDLASMAGVGRGTAGKVTVIRIHDYEAETDICSGSVAALVVQGVNLALFGVGDPLVVGNVYTAAVGGQCMRGLLEPTAAEIAAMTGVDSILARVVSVNANTGFVRFLIR